MDPTTTQAPPTPRVEIVRVITADDMPTEEYVARCCDCDMVQRDPSRAYAEGYGEAHVYRTRHRVVIEHVTVEDRP
jgi:hypothetical protein